MLRVIDPGPLTTVQDAGRFGYQQFGVPVSGAMDGYALRAANALVGNAMDAAGLEIGIEGLTLEVSDSCLIAVTGVGFELRVHERAMPPWTAIFVRRGWEIQLFSRQRGGWCYLAIAGGIQTPPVLGSRATYLRGGMGGRALQAGDELPVGPPARPPLELAGRHIPEEKRPAYSEHLTVEVIPGPQADRFTEEGRDTFLSSEYAISLTSDRMGYRLEGPPVAHSAGADIISDGLVAGSIQVPASGQPIVMMADRPTTGGYPKIATVVSADLPLLAQCPPGTGRLRFRETTVKAAQTRWRAMMNGLGRSIRE
jgi:biotin-dependent carboxylase-like uncharacterized protein